MQPDKRRPAQGRLPITDARRRLIATCQIGRKALGLDDDTWQALMQRITGHTSRTLCSDAQLERVVAELKRLGFKPAPGRGATKPLSKSTKIRAIWAVWTELRPHLDQADDTTLRAFVRRQTKTAALPEGIAAPEFLDDAQANRVLDGLKGWRNNVLRGEARA